MSFWVFAPLLSIGLALNAYVQVLLWREIRAAHFGRELLRRIARRCDVHDRAWPSVTRALESELGLEPIPTNGRLPENHCDPALIDCGHGWCSRRRRPRRLPEKGGHVSTAATIHDLPPLPEWLTRPLD